jgi:ubiquinone/menaquinone biosynthesis C-methylase UbiE
MNQVKVDKSAAATLKSTWNNNASTVEGAMYAILHGVRDPDKFDAEGRKEAEWLKKYITKDDIVLELGCGMGRIVKHISPHCKEINGIDISPNMLSLAGKWLAGCENVRLHECSGRDLGVIADGYIDFAYSLLVLQHMDKNDAYVYVKELFRVIKDGGTAVLNFPDIMSDVFFRDYVYVSLIPQEERDAEKVRSYHREEVERMLRSVGFTILDVWVNHYVFVYLKKDPEIFPETLVMQRNDFTVLDITGWYWLEQSGGYRYRWTRKRAGFFLKTGPDRTKITIKLFCSHPDVAAKGLELTLIQNNKPVSQQIIYKNDWQEVVFPIYPPAAEEISHFVLEADRTWVPLRDLGAGDGRELGVAVAGMIVG